MDQERPEVPTAARWLAWLTAILLAVAGVSASVVKARDERSGSGVVSAAGGATSTIEVPTLSRSTTTVPRAPTSTPPSTVGRSTTVPKAAAAVLAAIGSTTTPASTPPTAVTTTPTTRPPTTTTVAPTTSTSSTSTTSTTVPAAVTLTIVNDHPKAFVVTVNDTVTTVPGATPATGPVQVTPRATDTIEVRAVDDSSCVAGGVGAFFQAGHSYRLTIVAGQSACATFPMPEFTLTTLPA